MSTITLTAENIRDIIEEGHILTPAGYPVGGSVPCDIRDEMRRAPEDFLGAELWQFPCGAEQGTAVRCTSGRGAMTWGADSTWGDWDGDVFQADDDDRERFDANGASMAEVETEATYSVTFRGAATVDAYSATEGADDNDALTLTETRERCEAYGVSAELRDSAGFVKGFVSADGSYTLA
jgi:hypothetical protein